MGKKDNEDKVHINYIHSLLHQRRLSQHFSSTGKRSMIRLSKPTQMPKSQSWPRSSVICGVKQTKPPKIVSKNFMKRTNKLLLNKRKHMKTSGVRLKERREEKIKKIDFYDSTVDLTYLLLCINIFSYKKRGLWFSRFVYVPIHKIKKYWFNLNWLNMKIEIFCTFYFPFILCFCIVIDKW